MRKPFYSIGLIFKNEIRCLERCLKSLQPLCDAVPCEIVMADTGSDDGSREIAAKYADILFDFPWCDDFSAARNAVMERCSGEWYFSIDADEWLAENITELVLFSKAKVALNLGGIVIRNYKSSGSGRENRYMDFTALRLARLSTRVRYKGCIHEQLVVPGEHNSRAINLGKTFLYHDGYVYESNADMKKKYERNILLLKKKLKENPKDLQTLVECIDATREEDDSCISYARQAAEIIRQKEEDWEKKGPTVYRNLVGVAKSYKLPELEEWAEEAVGLFPNSIFTRIDVSYYMFGYCWGKNDYSGCIKWGERYLAGREDYLAGKYDISEPLRGLVEFSSPYWLCRLLILLSDSYLHLDIYDKAFSVFKEIDGAQLDEDQQVEACAHILLRLHRMSTMDTSALLLNFWEQINQPIPTGEMAEKRWREFLRVSAQSLTPNYRKDELSREGFRRHSYTVLTVLAEKCALGAGARVLEMDDPAEMERILVDQKIEEFPISAWKHALECGVTFPFPGKVITAEEIDAFTGRLASLDDIAELAVIVRTEDNLPSVYWKQSLFRRVLCAYKWDDEQLGFQLVEAFVQLERRFLLLVYSDATLTKEGICILPPFHRFGWYCVQAFNAQSHGDTRGYVRLLREGLSAFEPMKDLVGFLLDHTSEIQKVEASKPSAELVALADQVRAILSNYAPDDPAVQMLKQSEAYQKVAYLIEGMAVPVKGGLAQ